MKIQIKITSSLLLLLLFPLWGFSQALVQTLQHPLSARGWSMGGASTAAVLDGSGMRYNPAITSRITDQWQGNLSSFVLDIMGGSAYTKVSLKGSTSLAAILSYMDYGLFTARDSDGQKTGEFNVQDISAGFNLSRALTQKTSLGISLSTFHAEMTRYSTNAVLLGIGALYYNPVSTFSLGIAYQNVPLHFSAFAGDTEKIEATLRIGISKDLAHLPLTLCVDLYRAYAGEYIARLGGEFHVIDHLFLRFGSSTRRFQIRSQQTFRNFLAASSTGIGFMHQNWMLDLAFIGLGDAGMISSISISQRF